MSERWARRVLNQSRSSYRYEQKASREDLRLLKRIHELVRQHLRFAYRRIAIPLKREGFEVGIDRVYRLWRREDLKVPRICS